VPAHIPAPPRRLEVAIALSLWACLIHLQACLFMPIHRDQA